MDPVDAARPVPDRRALLESTGAPPSSLHDGASDDAAALLSEATFHHPDRVSQPAVGSDVTSLSSSSLPMRFLSARQPTVGSRSAGASGPPPVLSSTLPASSSSARQPTAGSGAALGGSGLTHGDTTPFKHTASPNSANSTGTGVLNGLDDDSNETVLNLQQTVKQQTEQLASLHVQLERWHCSSYHSASQWKGPPDSAKQYRGSVTQATWRQARGRRLQTRMA